MTMFVNGTKYIRISVIMPSFLGDYQGCASGREEKFCRAVKSFLAQDYPNRELVIVSDGCTITNKLYEEFKGFNEIKLIPMAKQSLFSGKVRQEGLEFITGDIICYLDSDDQFGANHLKNIVSNFPDDCDWVFFNDLLFPSNGVPTVKNVSLSYQSIGTSSIAHRPHKKASWKNCDGYGHDWKFIQKLMAWSDRYEKIYGMNYYICHVPNLIDS